MTAFENNKWEITVGKYNEYVFHALEIDDIFTICIDVSKETYSTISMHACDIPQESITLFEERVNNVKSLDELKATALQMALDYFKGMVAKLDMKEDNHD